MTHKSDEDTNGISNANSDKNAKTKSNVQAQSTTEKVANDDTKGVAEDKVLAYATDDIIQRNLEQSSVKSSQTENTNTADPKKDDESA